MAVYILTLFLRGTQREPVHNLLVRNAEKENGMAYNRGKAVEYAHQWAFKRNSRYLDFTQMGGDCTNFISQCLQAGGMPMNYQKTFGWYYNSAYDRAPAWSSVQYLYNFLINNKGAGPKAVEIPIDDIEIGDIIQLSFGGDVYGHSLLVVDVEYPANESNVSIATHTIDSDYRQLSTYEAVEAYRCLKIT